MTTHNTRMILMSYTISLALGICTATIVNYFFNVPASTDTTIGQNALMFTGTILGLTSFGFFLFGTVNLVCPRNE